MSLLQYGSNLPISKVSVSFDQPRRMVFGPNCVENVGSEAKRLGAGEILLVTDKGVVKAGLAERVLEILGRDQLKVTVYDNIAAEPTVESVNAAVDFARADAYKLVIGLGGGSALDSAKMCANMITNPGDPMDYVNPAEDRFKKPSVPKILIPTTAGTGSEVTNYAVVIEKQTMYKTWAASSNCFAECAVIDPTMTLTCPPRVTAGSGMDVAGHSMEGLISRESNPLSDALAMEAVKLVFRNLRKAYHNGDDLEARAGMSMAATFGGMVIAYPWIGGPAILGHCIAEALGPKFGIPHGVAVALALPFILEYNLPACTEKIASFAACLGLDTSGLSVREAASKVPRAVFQLMEDVELPTGLKQVNVPKAFLTPFTEYLVKERQYMYSLPKYNPTMLTIENIAQLLERMYEGALGS